MYARNVLALHLCLSILRYSTADGPGVVLLDELIFDKVVSRFQVAVVKFDTAFPYGAKHENFGHFAKEQNVLVKDLVIADVHIKDYGDKDNWNLLKRFRIAEKELPTILLFQNADTSMWIEYPKEQDVTVDNLKNFVRKNTKLYIGLRGCIEELDTIAGDFMEKFNRNEFRELERLIEVASHIVAKLEEEDQAKHMQGTVYVQIMRRIREKGIAFKEEERARVHKLLKTRLTQQKKRELQDRLNVLLSFRDVTPSAEKLEL